MINTPHLIENEPYNREDSKSEEEINWLLLYAFIIMVSLSIWGDKKIAEKTGMYKIQETTPYILRYKYETANDFYILYIKNNIFHVCQISQIKLQNHKEGNLSTTNIKKSL